MDKVLIAGAINFGIGAILSLIAFILYRKKSAKLKGSLTANGVVTGLTKSQVNVFTSGTIDEELIFREEENIFKGGSYAPLIEFSDKSGKKHNIQGAASSPPKYKIGQQVEIFYMESNPEKAIINSFLEKWLIVLMLGGFGAILLFCGVMILLFMK